MVFEEVNFNMEFNKILGNFFRWVNVLCFNLFIFWIVKLMFVMKLWEYKLCVVLIWKGIEIVVSLGDIENVWFNFGFFDMINFICIR